MTRARKMLPIRVQTASVPGKRPTVRFGKPRRAGSPKVILAHAADYIHTKRNLSEARSLVQQYAAYAGRPTAAQDRAVCRKTALTAARRAH